jgi:hypothetical protein
MDRNRSWGQMLLVPKDPCPCWNVKLKLLLDYGYADGRFTMSPRGVAVSNLSYLSRGEIRVNAGRRRWKLHLSQLHVRNLLVVSVSKVSDE